MPFDCLHLARSIGDVALYNGRCKASEFAKFVYAHELVWLFSKLLPNPVKELPAVSFTLASDPLHVFWINTGSFGFDHTLSILHVCFWCTVNIRNAIGSSFWTIRNKRYSMFLTGTCFLSALRNYRIFEELQRSNKSKFKWYGKTSWDYQVEGQSRWHVLLQNERWHSIFFRRKNGDLIGISYRGKDRSGRYLWIIKKST